MYYGSHMINYITWVITYWRYTGSYDSGLHILLIDVKTVLDRFLLPLVCTAVKRIVSGGLI